MRKSTIWLLVGVMGFTFIGLIFLQVNYISTLLKATNEQFDATVRRCLEQVAHDIELDEARRTMQDYFESSLSNDMLDNQAYQSDSSEVQTLTNKQVTTIETRSTFQFQTQNVTGKIQSFERSRFGSNMLRNNPSKDAIIHETQELQKNILKRREYTASIINEILDNLTSVVNLKPIEERIDFDIVDDYINYELTSSGLELPYIFMIVNKDGKTIFQNETLDKPIKTSDLITQVLFPIEPISQRNYLKIYFPTKKDYITSSITFLVPSVLFSLILLLTFTFTIYTIFRQKKLSEMKNDFVNNMTHELKTPVSTISLAAQMLKDTDINKSPDVYWHISGVISDETRRLGFLVEKVLQISLFEKQKSTLKLKEIDANDLLVSIVTTFALKVEKFGGNIDIDLEAENSLIYVDEMHITNVLFNLLDNALKYRRNDINLQLMARTKNDPNKLYISIEDNGIGIKKEHLKKVFDRFFRVPSGNIHDVKGFGLGLAYVRKIIEEHGGSIRAEQEEKFTGTKFIITLPLIKNQ
ncbi:MAG: HAMP domain-containing histidine kinase [Tannerella sp.]|jgi:signal transduction histidine kinase|nr:HAMP domain-containing histidine kinase [Tannerella sp.]